MLENVHKIVPILTKLVSQIHKSKIYVYKQKDQVIAKEMVAGQISDISVANLPDTYDVDSMEQFYFVNNLVINQVPLQYVYSDRGVLVLENAESTFVSRAAIITYPSEQVLICIAFEKTNIRINFYQEMYDLLWVFREQNVFRKYNLVYVPQPEKIVRDNDANLEQYLLFQGQKLPYFNNPVRFDIHRHRFGMVVFLNPIFSHFHYLLQQLVEVQEQIHGLFIVVCVKGCVQNGRFGVEKIFGKCIFDEMLNITYEVGTVADRYLGQDNAFSCQLIDYYPQPGQKVPLVDKNNLFSDYLRQLVQATDPRYNRQCNVHPLFLYKSTDFKMTMQMLADAFQVKITERIMYISEQLLAEGKISFYGITQTCRFVQGLPLPTAGQSAGEETGVQVCGYAIIFLNSASQLDQQLVQQARSGQVAYLFCIRGLTKQTMKMFQASNPLLQQVNIIYDTENMFRVLTELWARPNDFRINVRAANSIGLDVYLCDMDMQLITHGCRPSEIANEFRGRQEAEDIKEDMRQKAVENEHVRREERGQDELVFSPVISLQQLSEQ